MSVVRLRNPECILIHIPKTGGTSIRNGVWKKDHDMPRHGHMPKEWQKLFKFAFVRHPFDRFVSVWKMFSHGTSNWRLPTDAYPISLEECFNIASNENIIYGARRRTFEERIRHHAIPQTHLFNCLHLADFVGRYERLEQDFAVVAQKLQIDATLPKMHATSHGHWSHEIPDTMIEKLYNYYQKDFGMLGYEPRA